MNRDSQHAEQATTRSKEAGALVARVYTGTAGAALSSHWGRCLWHRSSQEDQASNGKTQVGNVKKYVYKLRVGTLWLVPYGWHLVVGPSPLLPLHGPHAPGSLVLQDSRKVSIEVQKHWYCNIPIDALFRVSE